MYNRLLELYLAGKLSEAQLDVAVSKGWINDAQKDEIIASK